MLSSFYALSVFMAINAIYGYSMAVVLRSGQLNLAQAGLAGIGAYTSSLLSINQGLPFPVVVLVAGGTAAAMAVLVGLPVLRLRGVFLAIATLAFAQIVQVSLVNSDATKGAIGLGGMPVKVNHLNAFAAVAVVLWLYSRLNVSRMGRGMDALHDDEIAAAAAGINPRIVKLFVFAVSGALAGVGGAMFAHLTTYIVPSQFGFSLLVQVLLIAVLGGFSSAVGPVLGAVLVTSMPLFLTNLGIEQVWVAPLLNGFILIVVIFALPKGLAGLMRPIVRKVTRRLRRVPGLVDVGDMLRLRGDGTSDVPSGPVLAISGMRKSYGGVHAVDDVSISVDRGEILGIIGPNGAGKTSLVNVLTGFSAIDEGHVDMEHRRLTGLSPHRISRAGISRTFQSGRLFESLSVAENIMVGGHARLRETLWGQVLMLPSSARREARARAEAVALAELVGLGSRVDRPAGDLSYGERRRLEIARALCSGPAVLVLDEPAAGMNRSESRDLGDLLHVIRDAGITILLIDHNMSLVSSVCDRLVVLNFGRLIAEGTAKEVLALPVVRSAYLGSEGGAEPQSVNPSVIGGGK
jgi:branched-chain amino acid transport system permease protein